MRARIVPAGKEVNGVGKKGKDEDKAGKAREGLKVPKTVVDEGLVMVRECLADVVEIES